MDKDKKNAIVLITISVIFLLGVGAVALVLFSGCQYDGGFKLYGSNFQGTDGCNTCYCSWGNVACTEMACIDTDSDNTVNNDATGDNEQTNSDTGEEDDINQGENNTSSQSEELTETEEPLAVGNSQDYAIDFTAIVPGSSSGYHVDTYFLGPTGLMYTEGNPQIGSSFGGVTIFGTDFSLVVAIHYESFENSFVGRVADDSLENPHYGRMYRIIPYSEGQYMYVNNVSETQVCNSMGDMLTAPCGLPLITWNDDSTQRGLGVYCTAVNTEICDEIVENIRFEVENVTQ